MTPRNPPPPRQRHVRRAGGLLVLTALASGLAWARPVQAQSVKSRLQGDFGDLLHVLTELGTQLGSKSRGEFLSFVNRVELFNLESEMDRLVGSPWELSDSTSYKLSLAPLHLAYPVFDQQVRQITRLDDIRSRRIQELTVDSLDLIAVDLDLLNEQRTGAQLSDSILHYFNAREVLDLGVFMLAQQPLFPQTPEAWDETKHRLATHQGMVAIGVAGLGALFEAGALSNSGTLKKCSDDACRVGWYGGFSHLGYHLQPNLRGGLTLRLPWLELSAGWREQVRPAVADAGSVVEMAVRESWLGRQSTSAGWNSFFEGAVRRVVRAEGGYPGETFTARGGLFVKHQRPFRWRHIVLRGSTEIESNLTGSLRYALGFGVDYTKTGLSAVLQSSRTNVMADDGPSPETRTGLFVAGTVEAPDQYFIAAMRVQARRLREEWNNLAKRELERQQAEAELRVLAASKSAVGLDAVVASLRRASAESEQHRRQVATLLGDYLEARRLVYSIKQWKRSPDDLHGPLDAEVLEAASAAVQRRLAELAAFLAGARATLEDLRGRYTRTVETAATAEQQEPEVRARAEDELAAIDREWRRYSGAVTEALELYEHYLHSRRRIAGLAVAVLPARHFEPLDQRSIRKLLTLIAQPLY
jgi:hypothetical protein